MIFFPLGEEGESVWFGGGWKNPEVLIHGEAPQRAQGEQELVIAFRTE